MSISIFKVVYHYSHTAYGGKLHEELGFRQDYIGAASGDSATLSAVLVSNGKAAPAGSVIVFDSIVNAGVVSALT